MIKLNRQAAALEEVLERIEEKIEELEEKKETITDAALDEDRELTQREYNKLDKIDEEIENLEQEADDIQNALDYINEYTEY